MDADSFHRLTKVLVDSGEAATLAEAQNTFMRYGVRIVLDMDIQHDPVAQVIALTALNTAARSFRGNVQVIAPPDVILTVPGFYGRSLAFFLDWLSLNVVNEYAAQSWPIIAIGQRVNVPATIRPWSDGWNFGIGPNGSGRFFAPAAVAAGALAVSEAFSVLRGDNPYAGRRSIQQSLWSVSSKVASDEPLETPPIPSLWLIGLGHLGQAYAWTLGFMQPATGATLYLQDTDIITGSTLSTSVLSTVHNLKVNKTRTVAPWLEERGYHTAVVERRFDGLQRLGPLEPGLALFGVDNPAARRVIESAGFRCVIDAGLGAGYRDFRAVRIRKFPGPSSAATLWAASENQDSDIQAPAYKALIEQGMEPCGVTTLATRAVGAPFVGCVAAAYVVAELLRSQLNGPSYGVIDFNLRDLCGLDAVEIKQ